MAVWRTKSRLVQNISMGNKATIKRKIQIETYEDKLQIINYVDANKSMKLKDIAAYLSLSNSTLSDIMKNREKIKAVCQFRCQGNCRQMNSYCDSSRC